MALVFGLGMVSCAATPNYYTVGDVVEENSAQIGVDVRAGNDAGGIAHRPRITIDGQGSLTAGGSSNWSEPAFYFGSNPKVIVLLAPGTHTFAGAVLWGQDYKEELPVSITYDVVAGKGYICSLHKDGDITGIFALNEYDIDEKGNFSRLGRKVAEVSFNYHF